MEHSAHLVDILDDQGHIVSNKRRIDVKKPQDIYHTVHTLLITPRGEIVLSTIPVREDLPNMYAQRMGTTVASIRRTGESSIEAADRSVERELFIDHLPLKLAGEKMYTFPQQRRNYMSLYYGVGDPPNSYSLLDIGGLTVITPREVDRLIAHHPQNVADSFVELWRDFKSSLPL